jgi:hypothetical protein
MAQVQQSGNPVTLTASGVVSPIGGSMIGYHVNSTTGGTIVLRSGGASGAAVTGTITPSVGFNAFPAHFPSGCYATLANTINVTFFFTA